MRVDGRLVRDPRVLVVPERVRIAIDGVPSRRAAWRTLLFYKPRGIVTTRRDPEHRRTVYDALGDDAEGLIPVGRLDMATAGLLLLTTDTRLADWITDPGNAVPRVYLVTVRGRVEPSAIARLLAGVVAAGVRLRAHAATIRKASARESHLTLELREGRNREVRRLFEAIGHEVTSLKRVRLGNLELGGLKPGQSRSVTRDEVRASFPGAPL